MRAHQAEHRLATVGRVLAVSPSGYYAWHHRGRRRGCRLTRRSSARPCPAAPSYRRRQPEQTVLYRTIATHLPTFFERPGGEDGTSGWPAFVRREFEAYLRCGILDHGVLRVRCERCVDTTVVAFA